MKLKLIVLLTFFNIIFLTGCGDAAKEVKYADKPLIDLNLVTLNNFSSTVEKNDNILVITTKQIKFINTSGKKGFIDLMWKQDAYSIHSAFIKLSENIDAKYFVILNPGISNIEGFPINNMKDLERYMLNLTPLDQGFLEFEKVYLRKEMSLRNKEINLFVLPLENKIPNIPVWTLSELKDYYKNNKF